MNICSEWIAENGKAENQRARIYQIALSGLREMNTDVNGVTKIVELTINDNDTVDLPDDFVNYSKIGIIGGDGRVHCLGMDNSISMLPFYNDCGEPVVTPNTANSGYPFYGLPMAGSFYGLFDGSGAVFGIGGGNNAIGYYRINREAGQIWLANLSSTLVGTSILLEYVADVNSVNGDFGVHPYVIQTVKDWISWKYVAGDRNTSLGEKDFRRREYFNSLRIAKSRYASLTPQLWAEALRASNTASPRF